jgi:hypothetical protein
VDFSFGGWRLMRAPGHAPTRAILEAARRALRDNPATARNHLMELQAALDVRPAGSPQTDEQLLEWLGRELDSRRLMAEPAHRQPPYYAPALLLEPPAKPALKAEEPERVERREETPAREEAIEYGPQAHVFAHASQDGQPFCDD